jgi:hypothetical protein
VVEVEAGTDDDVDVTDEPSVVASPSPLSPVQAAINAATANTNPLNRIIRINPKSHPKQHAHNGTYGLRSFPGLGLSPL